MTVEEGMETFCVWLCVDQLALLVQGGLVIYSQTWPMMEGTLLVGDFSKGGYVTTGLLHRAGGTIFLSPLALLSSHILRHALITPSLPMDSLVLSAVQARPFPACNKYGRS